MGHSSKQGLKRIPPHSVELERAVLGVILKDPNSIVAVKELLPNPNAFYTTAHRKAYEAMLDMTWEGEAFDHQTLNDELRKDAEFMKMGGISLLAELVVDAPTSSNVEDYSRRIRDKWLKRRFIERFNPVESEMYEDSMPYEELMEAFFSGLISEDLGERDTLIQPLDIPDRRAKGIALRRTAPLIKTGYPSLDRFITLGFSPLGMGISIIAGRTSMGKSALKTNLICYLCKRGFGVLSVSPEQGFDIDQDRIDAIETGIPLAEILGMRAWPDKDNRFGELEDSAEKVSQWPLYTVEAKDTTLSDIQLQLNLIQSVHKKKIHVVFVDLFSSLADVSVAENQHGVIKERLKVVSRLAQRFDTHFCLLVQISRRAEQRRDHRPTLGDLKESGSYEEDSDLIFFLHREGWYLKSEARKKGEEVPDCPDDQMDVRIAKQKHGPSGSSTLTLLGFDPQTLRIFDVGEAARKEPEFSL